MSDAPDDPDLLAAEYVLGVLGPGQARALEALAVDDGVIQASMAAWQARLLPLADTVPPVSPPPLLWRRLALAAGLDAADVVPRRVFRGWRAGTIAATALAASLAVFMLARPAPPAPLLAALSPYGSPGAMFLVRVGSDGSASIVAVGAPNTPAGRVLELWAVSAGAPAPVSLGLLPGGTPVRLRVPPQPGTQLLVSQEPAGGSPTGQPTGPVVYAGLLAAGG